MSSVNFLSLLSEFDFESYIPLIMNMKKEGMCLLFRLTRNFASSQCLARCYPDDIVETKWLGIWDVATSTIFSWSTSYNFFKHLDTFLCQKTVCFIIPSHWIYYKKSPSDAVVNELNCDNVVSSNSSHAYIHFQTNSLIFPAMGRKALLLLFFKDGFGIK